jgi:hypothetical protein
MSKTLEKESYSTMEICSLLSIKKECLRVWLDEGYIEPSIQKGIGPGTKHIFSKTDVFDIEIFHRSINLGFSRQLASKAVRLSKKAGAAFEAPAP